MSVFFLALILSNPALGAEPGEPDHVGVLVGTAFLRAVTDRDAEGAFPLCADSVSFDGKLVKGAKNIFSRLEKMFARIPPETRFVKVIGIDHREMLNRFGPPPERIASLATKNSIFVLGRLQKGGLIVILQKIEGRYRITGITS